MNFNMTDDQQAFADVAKQFAMQELAPFAAPWGSSSNSICWRTIPPTH